MDKGKYIEQRCQVCDGTGIHGHTFIINEDGKRVSKPLVCSHCKGYGFTKGYVHE